MKLARVAKRTFEAKNYPPGSEERVRLNCSAETSEYYPSVKWLALTPALMIDGSPNPAQEFHSRQARSKSHAQSIVDEWNRKHAPAQSGGAA